MKANADGSLTLFGENGEPLAVEVGSAGLSYERQKGPKVTVELPDTGQDVGAISTALANFRRIIGVDTNTKEHRGEKISVTVVCELSNVCYAGPTWTGTVDPLWALEFRNPPKDPERMGWRHALAKGEKLGLLVERTLWVVDSHLGERQAIDRREAPIIDDFFLPPSVSLAYASSDAATDSPLNGLMARCDRFGRDVLRTALEQDPPPESGTALGRCRYWQIVLR
jgi:hypothetical protein